MPKRNLNNSSKYKNLETKNYHNKKSFLNIPILIINDIFNIVLIFISIMLLINTIFYYRTISTKNFLYNFYIIFFGKGIYIFPFTTIILCTYNLIKKVKKSITNFLNYIFIFLLLSTFLNILFYPYIKDISSLNINNNIKKSYGIISELICFLLYKIFGKISASIFIITILIISIILITKKPLLEIIQYIKNYFINTIIITKKIINFFSNNFKKESNKNINNIDNNFSIQINGIDEEVKDIRKVNDIIIEDFNNNKKTIEDKDNKNNFFTNIELYKNDKKIGYKYPSIDFLKKNSENVKQTNSKSEILENSIKLEETLKSFGVDAKVIEVSKGPTVTRYEVSPGHGVKVSKISNLSDDLALNLAAKGIRIESPIPGKAAVGIEIPNKEINAVYLREVLENEEFKNFPSSLAFALGKDISGKVIITDIAKMPHLLIAGSTGSGKSVCINTLITSLLYKSSPNDVRLIMIDPKVVELSIYNGIPHLIIPVVTDPKNASCALKWAVREMLRRYELFASANVRDLESYNKFSLKEDNISLPKIVIIIDELSDLMMAAPNEVEDSICRLAQMARAAGLHLIVATQRPSVDVITGIIKANIPSRLAFSVSSGIDSRTILDMTGAEKLLGNGDMLFYPSGMNKPIRVQGAYINDKEVQSIVKFLKDNYDENYDSETIEDIISTKNFNLNKDEKDELFDCVVDFIIEKQKASASLLQRQFRIGFNKASRIIESLEDKNFISKESGTKPRKVLITKEQWYEINKK